MSIAAVLWCSLVAGPAFAFDAGTVPRVSSVCNYLFKEPEFDLAAWERADPGHVLRGSHALGFGEGQYGAARHLTVLRLYHRTTSIDYWVRNLVTPPRSRAPALARVAAELPVDAHAHLAHTCSVPSSQRLRRHDEQRGHQYQYRPR